MSSFLDKLLSYYHLDQEGYADLLAQPSFSDLPSLENDDGAKKIIARLEKARSAGERLLIYGDYDTDGIMATSIMKKALSEYGIEAKTYLPSRYLDGYGLNEENAKRIAASSYQLVLLVDNGVSASKGIEILNEHGIDVLIIDHHEIVSELPKNEGIVHPDTSHYPKPPVSAGYLSFLFSCLLLNRVDAYLLTLGALSTLSDMMPLKEHNRKIVKLALRSIQSNHYPQITDFLEKYKVTSEDLSMSLIPSINAIGRMEEGNSINRLVHYFADPYDQKSIQIAEWMKAVNEERKALTKQAMERIEIDEEKPCVFYVGKLKEGLNGLLANRLLNQYKKPIVVLSEKEGDPSKLVGSIRSLPGFDVMEAFSLLKPYLLAGGGHPLAGGLTIKKDDLEAVEKELNSFALLHPIEDKQEETIEIIPEEINLENVRILESFAPFGQEWKKPKFLLKGIDSNQLTFFKDGKYLGYRLENGSRLFSFALGSSSFAGKGIVNLKGEFRSSSFKGKSQAEFLAEEIA